MPSVYEVSDFRNGLKIEMDGYPWTIVSFQHVKPGKGNAFTRTKLRNLVLGTTIERTFKSGEKFEVADLEQKEMQFLYKEGTRFNFMDTANYEQTYLEAEHMGSWVVIRDGELVGVFDSFEVVGASENLKISAWSLSKRYARTVAALNSRSSTW